MAGAVKPRTGSWFGVPHVHYLVAAIVRFIFVTKISFMKLTGENVRV